MIISEDDIVSFNNNKNCHICGKNKADFFVQDHCEHINVIQNNMEKVSEFDFMIFIDSFQIIFNSLPNFANSLRKELFIILKINLTQKH